MSSTRHSSSAHTLSADVRLTKFQRIVWMLHNLRNNAFANSDVDDRMVERGFLTPPDALTSMWSQITEQASPSRRLCDMFWMRLPWSDILATLKRARVLEVGCGTGVYGQLIERLTGDHFEHYRGVDIDANDAWSAFAGNDKFEFVHGRAAQAMDYFKDANLLLTQSALEHFEEDLQFFEHVANYVAEATQPVLQFHLVPLAPCLLTYPWHGVREYTPRTLSRITRLFDDQTRIYLYRLGGRACNKLHRNFITWPRYIKRVDYRETQNERYNEALREAMQADNGAGSKDAAFYALVFATGFANDPFATWQ